VVKECEKLGSTLKIITTKRGPTTVMMNLSQIVSGSGNKATYHNVESQRQTDLKKLRDRSRK